MQVLYERYAIILFIIIIILIYEPLYLRSIKRFLCHPKAALGNPQALCTANQRTVLTTVPTMFPCCQDSNT